MLLLLFCHRRRYRCRSVSMACGQLVFNGVAIDIAFSFCYIVGDKFGKELTDGAEDKDK